MDSLLLSISKRYPQFSSVDKRIADLMIEHPKEIVHMPVKLLAQKANVSESALVRFAKRIGLTGIKQLKLEIAKELHTIDVISNKEHVVGNTFDEARQYLQYAEKFIQQELIDEVAQQIKSARKIVLYAQEDYRWLFLYLFDQLKQLGYTPIYCLHLIDLERYIKHMNASDLLLLGGVDEFGVQNEFTTIGISNHQANKGRTVIHLVEHEAIPQLRIMLGILVIEMMIKKIKLK